MGRLLPTTVQIWGLIMLVGLFGMGLSLFSAAMWVWMVTALMMIYLLRVGLGGLLPASLWATLLIALLVIHDRFPLVLSTHFPDFSPQGLHYRYWAMILLLLWAIAISIFFLMGRYRDLERQQAQRDRWLTPLWSIGSVVIGLSLGHQLGHLWFHSS